MMNIRNILTVIMGVVIILAGCSSPMPSTLTTNIVTTNMPPAIFTPEFIANVASNNAAVMATLKLPMQMAVQKPLFVIIGTNGNCLVESNTSSGQVTTVCPTPPRTNVTVTASMTASGTIQAATNLIRPSWMPVAQLTNGGPVVIAITNAQDFYRLQVATVGVPLGWNAEAIAGGYYLYYGTTLNYSNKVSTTNSQITVGIAPNQTNHFALSAWVSLPFVIFTNGIPVGVSNLIVESARSPDMAYAAPIPKLSLK